MAGKFLIHFLRPNLLLCIGLSCLCTACKDKPGKEQEKTLPVGQTMEHTPVEAVQLKKEDFNKELTANGKLRARNNCLLRFSSGGNIVELNVKNGTWVEAGAVIARQDEGKARLQYESAVSDMEKATLALEDGLLGFGYQLADSSEIPPETLKIAKLRSGWNTARVALRNAQLNLESCTLRAPIAGKIADLDCSLYEFTGGNEFCKLVNDAFLEVDFRVLETELQHLAVGQSMTVSPFIDLKKEYEGKITEINPIVNENGQIAVRAQIKNPGDLLDGMNVKVFVQNRVPDQLVVPKSAVLIRGDHTEVVFRVSEDHKAIWTYVHVVMENSRQCAVEPDIRKKAVLKPGDWVITSGNLNLANGSPVEIINP